jgi:hypothetical protein
MGGGKTILAPSVLENNGGRAVLVAFQYEQTKNAKKLIPTFYYTALVEHSC